MKKYIYSLSIQWTCGVRGDHDGHAMCLDGHCLCWWQFAIFYHYPLVSTSSEWLCDCGHTPSGWGGGPETVYSWCNILFPGWGPKYLPQISPPSQTRKHSGTPRLSNTSPSSSTIRIPCPTSSPQSFHQMQNQYFQLSPRFSRPFGGTLARASDSRWVTVVKVVSSVGPPSGVQPPRDWLPLCGIVLWHNHKFLQCEFCFLNALRSTSPSRDATCGDLVDGSDTFVILSRYLPSPSLPCSGLWYRSSLSSEYLVAPQCPAQS